MYLAGKIQIFDRKGHAAKLCIVFLPLLAAALVGVSRVDDYWHHWQDVFAGGLIGFVIATLCYRQFFPAPYESTDSSLYPLHRCKTLHLVRHAQGHHNVAGEKDHSALCSNEFVDASLTPLGWQQVENLRKHVAKSDFASRIELVVTSPLTRAMQTAAGVFGGGGYIDGDLSPLMVAGAGNSDRSAISSSNCPPFIAVELCRERIGVHPCDKRKSISEYRSIFPAIDFSLVETDEDVLWAPDVREKEADIAARGRAFFNWILTRKEKEIAIMTHSSFLLYTLTLFGKDCNSFVINEIQKPFANCELRSFVIADKSDVGTSLPITKFPGCIPSGSDVPSDHDDVGNAKN